MCVCVVFFLWSFSLVSLSGISLWCKSLAALSGVILWWHYLVSLSDGILSENLWYLFIVSLWGLSPVSLCSLVSPSGVTLLCIDTI